ncbi:non-ribosomal peptide synthetase condensation domain protein, partial [Streptomyces sp. NPDC051132]
MTTVEERTLTLDSAGSGTGPATWGQRAIWGVVTRLGDDAPPDNLGRDRPQAPPPPPAPRLPDL